MIVSVSESRNLGKSGTRFLVQGHAGVGLCPLEQFQHLLIAEDLEGRQVRASGVLVAPVPPFAQIGQLAAGQPAGPLIRQASSGSRA